MADDDRSFLHDGFFVVVQAKKGPTRLDDIGPDICNNFYKMKKNRQIAVTFIQWTVHGRKRHTFFRENVFVDVWRRSFIQNDTSILAAQNECVGACGSIMGNFSSRGRLERR